MHLNKIKKQIRFQSRGIALIMSLVILLILTLLGVTSMNTSNLQLLMTSNSQYQTTALNTAEDVIHIAENAVASLVVTKIIPSSGYYNITSGNDAPVDIASLDWSDNSNVVTEGISQYIIEYAGDTALDSSSLAWRQNNSIAGGNISVFRITARSPSSRGAVRYVQSIYVTIDSPS